jgi:hypothetical protein
MLAAYVARKVAPNCAPTVIVISRAGNPAIERGRGEVEQEKRKIGAQASPYVNRGIQCHFNWVTASASKQNPRMHCQELKQV